MRMTREDVDNYIDYKKVERGNGSAVKVLKVHHVGDITDKLLDYVEELEAEIAKNSPELVHDVNVTLYMENTQLKEKLRKYEEADSVTGNSFNVGCVDERGITRKMYQPKVKNRMWKVLVIEVEEKK